LGRRAAGRFFARRGGWFGFRTRFFGMRNSASSRAGPLGGGGTGQPGIRIFFRRFGR
jgi:hypothetical protein